MTDLVTFIYRTDVHVADRSPDSWKGDYPSEIWSSLEQIGKLARKHNATAVLDGGDFFHVKAPTQNSHGLVSKVSLLHQEYPCPVFSIEGNHDIKHNNLETLEGQPLGVLYNTGVFEHLRDSMFQQGSVKVRVVGLPYNPFRTVQDIQAIRKREGEYLVVIIHALAAANPSSTVDEFFGEPVFRYDELIVEGGPDVFMFGHWHKDQGIVTIDGRHFVNQGAVSRGSLSRENLSREPKVALLEFGPEGFSVASIPLDVAPASEVFDLERKQRRDDESKVISQYVERIKMGLEAASAEDNVEDTIKRLDFAQEIHTEALSYLELARGGR